MVDVYAQPNVAFAEAQIRESWGCFEAKASFTMFTGLLDPVAISSAWSGMHQYGNCLDPAPVQVPISTPEPQGIWGLASLFSGLVLLNIFSGRRNRTNQKDYLD